MPEELSRNQSILRFDVILQHDWPTEQCLLHIRVFLSWKTKRPFVDKTNNEHSPNQTRNRRRRHMWVEFVVGSLLCSERFFSGYSGFHLSSKTNISRFKFDQESSRRRTTWWMCYLQTIIYLLFLFIYLFFIYFSRSYENHSNWQCLILYFLRSAR